MGLVVNEVCPSCKETVFMPLHCPQMRCPKCKEVDIINTRRERSKKGKIKISGKPHLFNSYGIKNVTCPKCRTEFSSTASLQKGKIFCPKCSNHVVISQEE